MPGGPMRLTKQCGSRRLRLFMWQWTRQESRSRLNRIIATEMAELLDCAGLFWRFECEDRSLCARTHSTLADEKAAEGQPHSTTLARGSHKPPKWRSFWTAPVFSGA